ncbi:MAG TPA: hypothetical protein VEA58_12990 [Anaerovoracaceae bacterium]|nr:hypothetical protein [Anaerovoracaceae bacterium]
MSTISTSPYLISRDLISPVSTIDSSIGIVGIRGSGGITTLTSQYDATMRARYEEIKGKTAAELAAMNIVYNDGSYFKDNKAYLVKNYIDKIEGLYDKLKDETGNYAYPLDIPQDFMAAIVNKYDGTMSKEDMIKMARDAYNSVKVEFSDSTKQVKNDIIDKGVANAEGQATQENPKVAEVIAEVKKEEKPATTSLASPPGETKANGNSLGILNNKWILIGGGLFTLGLITLIITSKSE